MKLRITLPALFSVVVFAVGMTGPAPAVHAQEIGGRKVKSQPQLVYPELAKKMNISGTVKVEIVIAPNGTVKSAKPVGGHPLLIQAAVDAAKSYKFEPAADETTATVPFHFTLSQ